MDKFDYSNRPETGKTDADFRRASPPTLSEKELEGDKN